MRRLLACVAVGFLTSCCGVSPTTPTTPAAPSILAGTWTGTIAVAGQVTPTTWTFTPMANAGPVSYDVKAAWNGAMYTLTASLVGAAFDAGGTVTSTCAAFVHSNGTGDGQHVSASWFIGDPCGTDLNGAVTLWR